VEDRREHLGEGASRSSDSTRQRPSCGEEVAGAGGRDLGVKPQMLEDSPGSGGTEDDGYHAAGAAQAQG
jgi:hypothetical protein